MRTFLVLLLSVLAASCKPTPQVAVDQCLLREYLEECGGDEWTAEEKASCTRRAPAEATRLKAAIKPGCRLL